MIRKIGACALALALVVFAQTSALAAKRVALVIGNDHYETLPSLNNAVKDADDIATKLQSLGFEVILKTDAGARDIARALARFEGILNGAEAGLVFYAGHGVQADGRNYLIPSDAKIEYEEDLRFEGIDAAEFMDSMARAGAPVNLLVLDACRDNPLKRRTRSAARGLTAVPIPKATKGAAILYSAGQGETAQDGEPGRNGVFTGALLAALDKPGHNVEQVFKETARRVKEATGGRQTPWNYSSLTGDFYFVPPNGAPGVASITATAPAAPAAAASTEVVFWQSVANSTNGGDYCAYLESYPKGSFVSLAKRRVAQYGASCARPTQTASRSLSPGTVFRDCEGARIASAGNDPQGVFCGPEMVVVPAGSFDMGSPPNERGRGEFESPVHRVTIPRPFAVSVYEVTRGDFAKFVRETGYSATGGCDVWNGAELKMDPSRSWRDPGFAQTDRHPVTCVDWNDAKAFVKWLGGKTGKEYRLLSDAEWEYTARAGTVTAYPWGNQVRHDDANYGKDSCCGGLARGSDRWVNTAPVGSLRANAFGLYDTAGNLWEWVEDCWNANYNGAPSKGEVRTTGNCAIRVIRGGSWINYASFVRSAMRHGSKATGRSSYLGFRVARSLP